MSLKEDIVLLLNEEKWTRAALNSYSVSSFKSLDELLTPVLENNDTTQIQEILAICTEHLQHARNSIIALYLSGMMKLLLQNIDDSDIAHLIQIFSDNYRKNIVEFLALRILEFSESKIALQALAKIYEADNQEEKLLAVWERLVQVDSDETEVVANLAEKREEMGEYALAIRNYKKTLHRYIAKKDYNHVKDVWQKLIELSASEIDFFYHAASTVEVSLGADRAVQLLSLFYPHIEAQEQWSDTIVLLKRILNYDSQNTWARGEIVKCYRRQYEGKANLEKYISMSNLTQNIRNVHEAIASFEKHIAFDKGNFVYHKSWGVGRIREVNIDDIVIDFARRRNHVMSIEMAGVSLETLPKYHIKVLKNIWKRDVLRPKVKKNVVWTLKTIIQSYNNCADIKIIRDELVPSLLSSQEWISWGSKARTILRSNPTFGVVADKTDFYTVHKKPVDVAEKTFHRFELERNFFDRLSICFFFLDTILKNKKEHISSDYFNEMMLYFVDIANRVGVVDEQRISALLLVEHVISKYGISSYSLAQPFADVYTSTNDIVLLITKIPNKNIRSIFITRLPEFEANWQAILSKLFLFNVSKEIADILKETGNSVALKELYLNLLRDYRRYRMPLVWLVRYIASNDLYSRIVDDEELLYITLLHVYELTLRDLDAKTNIAEQRKIQKLLFDYLITSGRLEEFFSTADERYVQRVYTLLQEVRHIDPKILLTFRNVIQQRFPDFVFHEKSSTEDSAQSSFFVTAVSYEKRQNELKEIRSKHLSDNSKEIEKARSYGDLRENAEYKAALERQQALQNKLMILEKELRNARIVDQNEIDINKVSFGTAVRLSFVKDEKEKVDYTILGPWESSPDHGIISYQSPLGQTLYNHAVNDTVELNISGERAEYVIRKISLAKF